MGQRRRSRMLAIRSTLRRVFPRNMLATARQRSSAAEVSGIDSVVKADHSSGSLKLYHKTNLLPIGLTPIAFVMPDIPVATTAINVFLGIVFPVHAHIGMAGVLTDYVPKMSKAALGPARIALLGVTTITVLAC